MKQDEHHDPGITVPAQQNVGRTSGTIVQRWNDDFTRYRANRRARLWVVYATIARRLLLRDRQAEVARRSRAYAQQPDRDAVEAHQTAAFNRVWAYCLRQVPFYRAWAAEHDLPDRVRHVTDLRHWPVLTKQVVLARHDEVFQGCDPTAAYGTGGTTGTPARYPRGPQDAVGSYADTYSGRAWWGLRPFDPYVHLWGHSHLFGGSRTARVRRALADRAVNAVRLDAYDLSDEALARDLAAVVRTDPVYLVGYTSAVFRLARHVESTGARLRLRRLRAVVVTAETASAADVDVVGRVFRVPVVIEYGSGETGTLATSRGSTWPLHVLWAGCVVQLDAHDDVVVTTLNDRLFPLVNYATGDRAEPGDVRDGNALTLARVLGRRQEVMRVRDVDGRTLELSLILPVHILKLQHGVTAVQFRQTDDLLTIFLSGTQPLDLDAVAASFARELRRDHPGFDPRSVAFRQIASPVLTPAGKHAVFV